MSALSEPLSSQPQSTILRFQVTAERLYSANGDCVVQFALLCESPSHERPFNLPPTTWNGFTQQVMQPCLVNAYSDDVQKQLLVIFFLSFLAWAAMLYVPVWPKYQRFMWSGLVWGIVCTLLSYGVIRRKRRIIILQHLEDTIQEWHSEFHKYGWNVSVLGASLDTCNGGGGVTYSLVFSPIPNSFPDSKT